MNSILICSFQCYFQSNVDENKIVFVNFVLSLLKTVRTERANRNGSFSFHSAMPDEPKRLYHRRRLSVPHPTPFFGKRVLYLHHSLWRALVRIRDRGEAPRHVKTYGANELPYLFAFVSFQNEKLELACPRRARETTENTRRVRNETICVFQLDSVGFSWYGSHPPQRPAAVGDNKSKGIGIPARCHRHSRRLKNAESYTLFPCYVIFFFFSDTLIIRLVFSCSE